MYRCRCNGIIYIIPVIIVFIYTYSYFFGHLRSASVEDHIINDMDGSIISRLKVSLNESDVEKDDSFVSAVLVMAAKRDKALQNHLEQLVRLRPSSKKFPIIISQDGSNFSVSRVASHFVQSYNNVSYMHHKGDDEPRALSKNYAYIAEHYHWALDKLFNETKYDFVIITEDDLDIANDFFSYFEWGKQVLVADQTVWCISAWNDNGLPSLVNSDSAAKIWRTDFFPGLGWMLTRELWMELSPKFPKIYWDDWMRTKEVRGDRSCLRPEMSRTAHNMKLAGKGSSGGLYKAFLSNIAVSSTAVDFSLLPYENMLKMIMIENFSKPYAIACLLVLRPSILHTSTHPSHTG
ncbi:hypothetical protein KIN20_021605 [Parelaphostrongylus tenuis]|uniref:Alpha-1,3-mannosyl-glycoprotein 2-beta-N-acetylglucosaminyltransferase n=1 Tax=Parelaphostrongylus tenuis TaxID=148309 RepID=A0AAD5QUN1_PARTN|nr:hypothetical protein KIN20_021605 [Parelaphostrongylus tenuis]